MPGPVQTLEYESSPGRWRFSSAAPGGRLSGIVQEYWEVEGRLSPFRERVLPNGCTETDKGTIELRATWTRTGPDSYRVAQSQRAGEAWKPLWAMELKRRRE